MTSWRPHPAALAACALAVGIFYFCLLTAPFHTVLAALAAMVLILLISLRWIQRPGLRSASLAAPDLSWKAMWPRYCLIFLFPPATLLHGELEGVSGNAVAVVLSVLVAAVSVLLLTYEARRV